MDGQDNPYHGTLELEIRRIYASYSSLPRAFPSAMCVRATTPGPYVPDTPGVGTRRTPRGELYKPLHGTERGLCLPVPRQASKGKQGTCTGSQAFLLAVTLKGTGRGRDPSVPNSMLGRVVGVAANPSGIDEQDALGGSICLPAAWADTMPR